MGDFGNFGKLIQRNKQSTINRTAAELRPSLGSMISKHYEVITYLRENQYFFSIASNAKTRKDLSRWARKDLKDLERVGFENLELDKVNAGKVVFCTTVTDPICLSSVSTIIIDEKNIGERLGIYNVIKDWNEANHVIPKNTFLALLHPLLKRVNDGGIAIRVDEPKSIIIFRDKKEWERAQNISFDEPFLSEEEIEANYLKYKDIGNQFFLSGDYPEAVKAYTDGISGTDFDLLLLCNRAECYIRMEKYYLALQDCEAGLRIDSTNIKLTYRKAFSLFRLGKREESEHIMNLLTKHFLQNSDCIELAQKIKIALNEYDNVSYDPYVFMEEMKERKSKRSVGHFDYFSDKIEINYSAERGRGVYAKTKIQVGTLLMVQKALKIVFQSETEKKFAFREDCRTVDTATQTALKSVLIRACNEDKDLENKLSYLAPLETKRMPPVSKSGFPFPVSNAISFSPSAEDIADLITTNGFDASSERSRVFDFIDAKVLGKNAEQVETDDENSCGIWFLASMLNHSCFPTSCVFFVGDVLFCVAVRELKTGDEVTFPYFETFESFQERQKISHSMGFTCRCRRCLKFFEHSELVKCETDFLEELKKLHIENDIASDPQLYEDLESLIYSYREYLKPPLIGLLFIPQTRLALLYKVTKRPDNAISSLLSAYNVLDALNGPGGFLGCKALIACAKIATESGKKSLAMQLLARARKDFLAIHASRNDGLFLNYFLPELDNPAFTELLSNALDEQNEEDEEDE